LKNFKFDLRYWIIPIIILVLFLPLFQKGFILSLDTIASESSIKKSFDSAIDMGNFIGIPYRFVLFVLNLILPVFVIQRILIFSIIILSVLGCIALSNHFKIKKASSLYFILFYLINPFTHSRFLAGHLNLLMAYALTPFFVKFLLEFIEKPLLKRGIKLSLLTTLIITISLHHSIMLFLIFICLLPKFKFNKNGLKIGSLTLLIFIVINMFWIPFEFSKPISKIDRSDLGIFKTKTDLSSTVLFTTASMHGFWRENLKLTKEYLPDLIWKILIVMIIALAVYGVFKDDKKLNYRLNFVSIALFALILATGISSVFKSLFMFLFDNLILFRGMREPQKFVSLLVLFYGLYGSIALNNLKFIFKGKLKGLKKYGRHIKNATIIFAILIVIFTSFMMINLNWKLSPVEYPKSWYDVNAVLNDDVSDFKVLFLPWHGYLTFNFTHDRIANPAFNFFDKEIVQKNFFFSFAKVNLKCLQFDAVIRGNMTSVEINKKLQDLSIKYAIVSKVADYSSFSNIYVNSSLIYESDEINLYLLFNNSILNSVD